ncbi:Stress-response A/B barrel domain-containing protein HS1 [Euphorbia peplus]|nr:Stress-response A/B barrel domain-containing protein HS1 [Euphorbia peplus]
MEEAKKNVVKHVLLAKFKDEIQPHQLNTIINEFASLVNLIPPMKSFHWGTDLSSGNLNQGYTHIFESTFDSIEDVAEYRVHQAHVEFANIFLPSLDKLIVIDYNPTTFHP